MEGKPLVPRLRFPEFQDAPEWELKPLRDVTDHLTEKVGDRQLIPVSISAGTGFVSQSEKFGRDISGAQYRNYIHLCQGDFSYNKGNSKRYPQGCVYELREFEEAAVPSAFVSFRFRRDYVNGFFQPQFEKNSHGRELRKFITSGARSDGLLNVSPDEFFSIQLPVPRDIAEQQKIAECLTSLDELIAAEGRKLEALRTHKKGLMQDLFPREGETVPRLRFPEFREAGEWEEKRIADLDPFVTSGSRGWAAYYAEHGSLFMRITNLSRKSIVLDLTDTKFVDVPAQTSEGVRTQLKEDDLLISITADVGMIGYVDAGIPSPAYINQHIALVRFPISGVCSKFIAYFLASENSQRRFRAGTDTGTKAGMNLMEVQNLQLFLPPFPEQQRVAASLSSLDALITAQANKLDTLKLHKQGLMQGLFPSTEEAQA